MGFKQCIPMTPDQIGLVDFYFSIVGYSDHFMLAIWQTNMVERRQVYYIVCFILLVQH